MNLRFLFFLTKSSRIRNKLSSITQLLIYQNFSSKVIQKMHFIILLIIPSITVNYKACLIKI